MSIPKMNLPTAKLLTLSLCLFPAFAFAKAYECQGRASVTLIDDNGHKSTTTKTLKLTLIDEPGKISLTDHTDETDPETYSGALDLTGRTDTQINNGGDISKVHTKLKGNKLEFSLKSAEGGIALTTLTCKTL